MINGPGRDAVCRRGETNAGRRRLVLLDRRLSPVINSVLAFANASLHFVIGLGTTEIIDSGARGSVPKGVAQIGAGLGLLPRFMSSTASSPAKGRDGRLLSARSFMRLMGCCCCIVKDWLAAAFHAYALFRIFQGFQAAQVLEVFAVPSQASYQQRPGYVPPSSNPSNDVWPPPPSA